MASLQFHAIALLQLATICILPGAQSLTNVRDSNARKCRENFDAGGLQMCNQIENKISCACTCDDECRGLQTKVRDCCKEQGVASSCLDLCRYDVNFNEVKKVSAQHHV